MDFTIGGRAAGAQAIGQGLGNVFKAAALGPMYKQQADMDRALRESQIYENTMSGNKTGTEAELKKLQLGIQKDPLANVLMEQGVPLNSRGAVESYLNTGKFGPRYDESLGPALPAPVDPAKAAQIGKAISLFNRTIGTGSNVQQMANAQGEYQTQDLRDQATKAPDIDAMNRLISIASGKQYTPFDNVGNTGVSINQATGSQVETNPVLMKLFNMGETAQTNQRNASANSSNAQAGKYNTENQIEKVKLGTLKDTGFLPGTRGSGGGDFGKIRDDIRADYNAQYPVDSMTRQRAKNAPDYDTYTKQWLTKYSIPESDYFGSGAQRLGANKNPAPPQPGATMKNPPSIAKVTGAPAGATIGSFVDGKGWQVKDKSGKVIGYAQE